MVSGWRECFCRVKCYDSPPAGQAIQPFICALSLKFYVTLDHMSVCTCVRLLPESRSSEPSSAKTPAFSFRSNYP